MNTCDHTDPPLAIVPVRSIPGETSMLRSSTGKPWQKIVCTGSWETAGGLPTWIACRVCGKVYGTMKEANRASFGDSIEAEWDADNQAWRWRETRGEW